MIIKKSKFVLSMSTFKEFPEQGLPEIAMVGKSNVGKSSMINSLTRNSKLARISSAPGKTRLVNYYQINAEMFLVDLPGYGFAKAPKQEKEKWAAMIEGYLCNSPNLKHVLQLVDLRHAPTQEDQMMVEYLRHYNIPFSVIGTKADKLSKAQRSRNIPVICRTLAVQPWEIIAYSSEDGTGKDKVLALIDDILNAPPFLENEYEEEDIIDFTGNE